LKYGGIMIRLSAPVQHVVEHPGQQPHVDDEHGQRKADPPGTIGGEITSTFKLCCLQKVTD
jgi:hypothetical protein